MPVSPDSPRLVFAPPTPPAGHNLLEGKGAVITAAAGTGIGASAARRMMEEGARVVISDYHEGRLEKNRAELAAEFGDDRVAAVTCDVTNQEQVDALVTKAAEFLGHIDVFVQNAGLGGEVPVADMTDEQWSRVLDVTLNSTFRCNRSMLRYWRDTHAAGGKGGVIVNNASVLGWRAQRGQAHYAAAKAGVMALTRCAAVEAAGFGVRVNAVSPSIAMHAFLAKVTNPELLEQLSAREAFGRPAEVWEVANVMVFLASDYSSYMTGEVVSVSSQRA